MKHIKNFGRIIWGIIYFTVAIIATLLILPLGFILVINVLAGCLVTTIALLTARVFSFFFVLIVFLLYLMFGAGMIFSIDFFPENFGMILKYVPFGLLIQELQQTLFYGEFHWLPISSLVLLIVPWIYINSEFLRRKLNQ